MEFELQLEAKENVEEGLEIVVLEENFVEVAETTGAATVVALTERVEELNLLKAGELTMAAEMVELAEKGKVVEIETELAVEIVTELAAENSPAPAEILLAEEKIFPAVAVTEKEAAMVAETLMVHFSETLNHSTKMTATEAKPCPCRNRMKTTHLTMYH